MTAGTDPRAAESLLAFWAAAGAETSFADQPVNRLVAPERAPRPAAAPPKVAASTPVKSAPDASLAIAEARRAAAEATTLDELGAAIDRFDLCPLKFDGGRRSVFCRGNPAADIMVIGEAPGRDEDVIGQPFVGRAGQLLDRMLSAAGLVDRAFITNTVFWRPAGNRTPTAAEQSICQPFVEKAILLVKPHYLLLAGGASAKAMLQREEGILSLRGRWFEWSSSDGNLTLPVLPTLHPAFLLRQPASKKKAWGDLLTLAERVDRPERDV